MDRFGDNLYNIYGSTEVAYASIATPEDLREAPSTAGQAAVGDGREDLRREGRARCRRASPGRIFVGNSLLFEGYTGGGQKDMIDGLMSSGDVGRFDEDGRLYVEGRDDEMIVSGGENVFPKEVEDCLARHDAVVEVAAIGVDDDDFGKRLRAFVVLRDGMDATEDDLKAHVKDNLARFKVPREIVFLDELPRNATGKVLKRELAEDGDEDSMDRRASDRARAGRRRPPTSRCATSSARTSRLSSYRGEKAVALVFYPYAFSGVCTGEMAGHPRPARRVPDLRHRGAGDLLRPGLRAAGVRRPGRAELPAALGLLAARRGVPRLRRLRRGQGLPAPLVVRHRQGRAWCAGRCTTPSPTAATSTSTWASSGHA